MNAIPVPPQRAQHGLTLIKFLVIIALIGILAAMINTPYGVGDVRITVERQIDGANLRSIGQAMLAYDLDNPAVFSTVEPRNIYGVAAQLARDGVMPDITLWFSRIDNHYAKLGLLTTVITVTEDPVNRRPFDSKLQEAAPAFAVAIFPVGTKLSTLPGTTPLAWTRGLLPDGTWDKNYAPYENWGGFVVFANGSVTNFKGSVENKLVKYGTDLPTSDIREALPPGTTISDVKSARGEK